VTKGFHDVVMRQVLLGTANVCGYLSAEAVVAPRPFGYRGFTLWLTPGTTLDGHTADTGWFRTCRTRDGIPVLQTSWSAARCRS
jgi:hypothetical protein